MKKLIKITISVLSVIILVSGCKDDIDPVITELQTDRAFAPVDLRAFVRNQTTIELNWDVKTEVDEYIVEFSEDSLEFNSIVRTVSVAPTDLPVQELFEGETRYSARVKAIVNGKQESGWASVTIMTAIENILLPFEDGDVAATSVTLRWAPGSEVTHITVNPGGIQHDITDPEKVEGVATIDGLTGETEYVVTLFNNAKRRGVANIETLVDIGDATAVYPEDDLLAVIADAEDGDVLALFPGEYGAPDAELVMAMDKSITIRGVFPFDRPIIYGQLTCGSAVTSVEVRDIDFRGVSLSQFFNTTASECDLMSLSIIDCEISGYSNNFIYNNNSGVFGTITISGSYVHSIAGGGGDGIDFRSGTIGSLIVENSTFANGFRTFLRMQAECNSVFENCTFFRVCSSDSGNNHGLFRSSGGGSLEVRSCLFVQTGVEANPTGTRGNFCRRIENMVDSPVYANNNISNCFNIFEGLYTSAAEVSATEIDPGLVDPENGDFTVTNQTIIDNMIGDPKWLQ